MKIKPSLWPKVWTKKRDGRGLPARGSRGAGKPKS